MIERGEKAIKWSSGIHKDSIVYSEKTGSILHERSCRLQFWDSWTKKWSQFLFFLHAHILFSR